MIKIAKLTFTVFFVGLIVRFTRRSCMIFSLFCSGFDQINLGPFSDDFLNEIFKVISLCIKFVDYHIWFWTETKASRMHH